jgi:hypothetical protein
MKIKLVLAGLLLTATAAPAFAAGPNENVCLRYNQVDGWGARDKHSMIVDDRFGRKYLVKLAGLCDDLNFAFGAGFRPLGGAGFCVDRGDRVVMRGGGVTFPHSTCWVSKVQIYTPEMREADKAARESHQPLNAY